MCGRDGRTTIPVTGNFTEAATPAWQPGRLPHKPYMETGSSRKCASVSVAAASRGAGEQGRLALFHVGCPECHFDRAERAEKSLAGKSSHSPWRSSDPPFRARSPRGSTHRIVGPELLEPIGGRSPTMRQMAPPPHAARISGVAPPLYAGRFPAAERRQNLAWGVSPRKRSRRNEQPRRGDRLGLVAVIPFSRV